MNSLVKSLIQPLLEANQGGIALVPGGFKPPTLGHFYLVNQVAKHPEVNKVIVLIGHKTRDGVTKEESKAIWDIYQKYLSPNVEIKSSDSSSPISDVSSLIKNNPDTMFYPVVGIRGEMDLGDLKRFDSMEGKYDNFKPIVIKSDKNEDRISGTNTRAALIGGDKDRFLKYLPTELSNEDKEKVWSILQKTPLNEMYAEPSEHDYPKLIKSLTEYMLDKGMNIHPLPKVKFVDDDIENARNFFGKTAYYDPNNRVIVLYTMERHPKDVMRSFAHEMIHHMQNCDNRLGNIKTQNTNEEGDLPEIEREAYEKGNMTFRNWTDTLTEGVLGDRIECDNCDWSWPIKDGGDDLYICHKCGHDNTPQLNEGAYDSIVSKLAKDVLNAWKSQFDKDPKRLFAVLDTTYELKDAKGRPMDFTFIAKLDFKKTKDRTYKVDGGADEGSDDDEGFVALTFQVDPRELPQMWSTIAMDIRDVLRHEIEHLTQGGWNVRDGKEMEDDSALRDLIQKYKLLAPKNYFMLDKEVDAMLQGMYFKAKKSRTPFEDVINDYLEKVGLEPEEKEEIKTRWRGRIKALSLPVFETKYKLGKVLKEEETEQKYTIYCDMDGVLTDFDKQFEKASGGIPPREYEEKNGKEAFWNLIDKENGVGFWVGMPWMPNGQTLWDYIKQYNPTLLSAPSRQNESRLGKRLWVKNNIPGTKLILANAENKQNYANDKSILIDDRPSNIDQWRSKGGIGILFVSTAQTIEDLKKLGL